MLPPILPKLELGQLGSPGASQNGNFTFTPFTRDPLSPRLPGAPGASGARPAARQAAGRGVMRSGRMVGKASGLQLVPRQKGVGVG